MRQESTLEELLAAGRLDEALEALARMPECDPARLGAVGAVSNSLISVNRGEEAIALVEQIEQFQPNTLWLVQLLARAFESKGDEAKAIQHYRHAFNLAPGSSDAFGNLQARLLKLGDLETASTVEQEHRAHRDLAIENLRLWQPVSRMKESSQTEHVRCLYLDLLERTVSNWIYRDAQNLEGNLLPFDPMRRGAGRDIPSSAHSMIGLKRLRHLREIAEIALYENIPGDFVEAGVWRGGACILLAGVLESWSDRDRCVVAADSFEGLPPPDERYVKDSLTTFAFHLREDLRVDLEQVRDNFERYGLLSERVQFLKGSFRDSLATYPYGPIAVLRMDGDLYSSTTDTLVNLYDRVSPGGFVVSDDYGVVIDARRAVIDFRLERNIDAELVRVDDDAVFWRKPVLP